MRPAAIESARNETFSSAQPRTGMTSTFTTTDAIAVPSATPGSP